MKTQTKGKNVYCSSSVNKRIFLHLGSTSWGTGSI